jgi:hypothetical protein
MRLAPLFGLGFAVASCTIPPTFEQPRLPPVDGHRELITTADVPAIVAAAKHRLGWWARVYRVHVFSDGGTEAYYGTPPAEGTASEFSVLVEHRGSQWVATREGPGRVVVD